MDRLPTLLIVAEPSTQKTEGIPSHQLPAHEKAAMQLFSKLRNTLLIAQQSGLPVTFIAPKLAAQQARDILPGNCIIELPQIPTAFYAEQKDNFAMAAGIGVIACANSNGWLILPAHNHMPRVSTLQKIANALNGHAIAYPQYKLQRGTPVAFSAELFSELVRMQSETDLNKLINRYPAMALNVDDPGILAPPPIHDTTFRSEHQITSTVNPH